MPKVRKGKPKCNIDHPTRKGKNNSRSKKSNEVNSCQFLYRIDDNYTSDGVVCEWIARLNCSVMKVPVLPNYSYIFELMNSSRHFLKNTSIRRYSNAFAFDIA